MIYPSVINLLTHSKLCTLCKQIKTANVIANTDDNQTSFLTVNSFDNRKPSYRPTKLAQ